MSNSGDRLHPASRALIAGAILGGVASGVQQWQRYRQGEQSLEDAACRTAGDAARAGLLSGGAMAVAEATAGRPLLTMLTVLSAGAAGLYLMDTLTRSSHEEQ
ncbi:hypothetical protein FJU30_16890 [Affinibrenneria salicis]|uniref:Uncharacterized protein n=1 Tax=Affinibrenneria salicis TaxID=2590031 RepID=A0A5J5FYG0_9GAMM|nr:hypothetical protein [Affinibrenneria salicis]KAA8998094.1 hypothetical protein FJU30_16890 [Affinibrenneria salicis]